MTVTAALPPTLRVLERGWLSSNSVVMHDEDGRGTVVDTGYVAHREQTLALVQRALEGRPLARIVNTHLHSDHCGGNAGLQRASGATIHIPPGHADAVRRWDEDILTYRATGQRCERFDYDGLLVPGRTIRMGGLDWRILASPGHDPNAVVLWSEAAGVLLSADALWENGFGVIFPELEGESGLALEFGFAEQRAMLDLIAALAPRLVIPGHGAPFADVGGALARAHARLDALAASAERNARHAARVLVKFYLLEVRSIGLDALVAHAAAARYFQLINERYFGMPFADFVRRLVTELAASGAAVLDGDTVRDAGA